MTNVPDPHVDAPYGYDRYVHVEVVPKPPPAENRLRWRIKIGPKTSEPTPGPSGAPATGNEEITVQLTADQQVELSISGEDKYDNPVDITGDIVWSSSDEAIVVVQAAEDGQSATAVAVGPVGTAAVTVSNDVDQDGTGDFQGSLAIDVVAGDIAEIVITEGEVTDKPEVDNELPGEQPEVNPLS